MAIPANQGDIEVEWNAADLEGRLSAKDITAWKEEVANYVHSYIPQGNSGSKIRKVDGEVRCKS